MNGAQVLIPLLVPIGLFAMIFGIVYLKSRENMAMMERGMNPKEYANRPAPFRSLKTGLLLLGAGLGLLIAFFIERNMSGESDGAIYFSLIAIGGGIGLIGSYAVEKKEWMNNKTEI